MNSEFKQELNLLSFSLEYARKNLNGKLHSYLPCETILSKPRLFDRPECRNCVFKGVSYCWNPCPYNIWRRPWL